MNKNSSRFLHSFGRLGLRAKSLVINISMILTVVAILTIYFISVEKALLSGELNKRAVSLAKYFAYDCSYPALLEDQTAISQIAQGMMNEEDVALVLVRAADGRALFIQTKDQAANEWAGAISSELMKTGGQLQLRNWRNYLLVSVPIFKPSDEAFSVVEYSGGHPREGRIAGAHIGFSLDRTRSHIVSTIRSTLLIAMGIAGVCVLIALLMVRYLMKPLQALMIATREVASGNLSYKVDARNDDELGQLAVSFNEMAARLEANKRALEEYSKDLERKVQIRTEEIERREEDLAFILEHNPSGIILVDAETDKIDWANSNALRILKGSREEVNGQAHERFLSHERDLNVKKDRSGIDPNTFESVLVALDGSETPVLKSTCRIEYKGREHFLHAFFDIAEYKELETQLMQAQKMGAIGTLAGGIAHDFNNLLQAILGYAQLILMTGELTEADRNSLYQIDKSARRGAELVKQLLTFSRKLDSRLRPLDLNEELEKVVRLLERTIPKSISLELSLGENIGKIDSDPVHLEQMVMNLALNARDAMPEGGRLVFASSRVLVDEEYRRRDLSMRPGAYVLLSVSDSGIGMDKKDLERIFEPFFTTKEIGKGTGLGLSMVYGIVKNHHGHITCSSAPGEGTTFNIYFPVSDGKEEEPVAAKQSTTEIRGGNETILLVDDEEAVLEIGTRALESFGYKVLTASDGEHALELFTNDDVELVILDLGMPGMGGERCLKELLRIDSNVRIVMASGHIDTDTVEKSLESGARGFIGKPYRLNEMLNIVRRILDSE